MASATAATTPGQRACMLPPIFDPAMLVPARLPSSQRYVSDYGDIPQRMLPFLDDTGCRSKIVRVVLVKSTVDIYVREVLGVVAILRRMSMPCPDTFTPLWHGSGI